MKSVALMFPQPSTTNLPIFKFIKYCTFLNVQLSGGTRHVAWMLALQGQSKGGGGWTKDTSDVGSEGADVTYPMDNNRCLIFTNFLQNLSTRPILLFCLRRCVYDDKNGLVRGRKRRKWKRRSKPTMDKVSIGERRGKRQP